MTKPVNSFAPITNASATILILGSMPGQTSLTENQYYAHPRNAFWPIMGKLYDFDATLPYKARINAIKETNIAIWDVLAQCVRPGSLDSDIQTGSRITNDFNAFLTAHPHIQMIGFNGAEAEKSFRRCVLPDLKYAKIKLIKLPSTSPAHTMPLAEKMTAWRLALTSY